MSGWVRLTRRLGDIISVFRSLNVAPDEHRRIWFLWLSKRRRATFGSWIAGGRGRSVRLVFLMAETGSFH